MDRGEESPVIGRQSSHEARVADQGQADRSREGSAAARGARQLAIAVVPPVLVLVALLVVAGSPGQDDPFAEPWQLLGWALVALLAALHRPLTPPDRAEAASGGLSGASLGLGTFVLPALLARQGVAAAAAVAGLVVVSAELLRGALVRRFGAGEAGGRLIPVLERAMATVLAVLVAGGAAARLRALLEAREAWMPWASEAWLSGAWMSGAWMSEAWMSEAWVSGATLLVYGAVLALAIAGTGRLRRLPLDARTSLAPLLLDLVGWALGAGLTLLASNAGWWRVVWLWPVVALLVLEAARHAILRGRADRRVGSFERLQEAHERILAEASGMGGIAEQILVECRNILPLQWFQFELPALDETGETRVAASWAAGPDGRLVEGRPKPPPRPQMLPGIHRRALWRVIERPLILQTPEGEDELLATLRLWCDPRRVEVGAEELLSTLLPQMAASVHRARLDREARLDPLTDVPVRRVLEASLQRGYRRACEEGSPMAVIMCDIDFFKRVNDTWGHDAGDEALKLVAATLDSTRRENDLCCRYGGEEFTILLERTEGAAALQLAERLRKAIESLTFIYDGQPIPLTLSLGIAAFPELTIKTASELLLLADEALYEAKKRGRNQSLLNVGRSAFLAPPGVPRQESSPSIERPTGLV